MQTKRSALILFLVGCTSAYYFPDGPPHRPSRQLPPGLPSDVPPPPEPKDVLLSDDDKPEPKEGLFVGHPTKIIKLPAIRSAHPEPDTDKPVPYFSKGATLIPYRMEPALTRQSRSCNSNYAFSNPGESVVVQSPNYPDNYPNNVDTSVCFTSPEGTTMSMQCNDFNVENHRTCGYDFLGVGLGGDPNSLQKYCGKGTVQTPASSSNSFAVVFKSDHSNPRTRDPFRFSCTVKVSEAQTDPSPAPPESGNCTCGQRNDRIVGGAAASQNEYPWRCYMKTKRYSFFCGCSVISDKWILTAAHCTQAVMPLRDGDVLYVVVGDHNRASSIGQQMEVESVHDHQGYNDRTMDNDISLLKLKSGISFNNAISPVCLPFNYANDNFQGTTVTASGWGATSEGGSVSNVLMEVDLPVLTTQECSNYLRGQITDNMICTYEPGKDTCQGDSGGSIDLRREGRFYAIGVVSWGIGCAREDRPGVYSKVTKYLDWIRTTSGGEQFCQP